MKVETYIEVFDNKTEYLIDKFLVRLDIEKVRSIVTPDDDDPYCIYYVYELTEQQVIDLGHPEILNIKNASYFLWGHTS